MSEIGTCRSALSVRGHSAKPGGRRQSKTHRWRIVYQASINSCLKRSKTHAEFWWRRTGRVGLSQWRVLGLRLLARRATRRFVRRHSEGDSGLSRQVPVADLPRPTGCLRSVHLVAGVKSRPSLRICLLVGYGSRDGGQFEGREVPIVHLCRPQS